MFVSTMSIILFGILLYAIIGVIVGIFITRMITRHADIKPTLKEFVSDVLAYVSVWPIVVGALIFINVGTLITEGWRKK